MPQDRSLPAQSRRSFLQLSTVAAVAAAAGFPVMTEPLLARPAERRFPPNAVVIDSNENPLGPAAGAREAAVAIVAQGGRYSTWLTEDLIRNFAAMEGLKPEYIAAFPGSSEPLHYSVLAFTSPSRSYVTADPGYEAGMYAAKVSGARIVKTALTKTYAHDVKAMLAAAPDAGLFYVCSPNNPTGTLTSHADIEFLLENKPKGSLLLVDEAYIHFSDATTALDLVRADKELIVLRTFSKIYGMAGLRCGFAIGRPDLLDRISTYKPWNPMPITAVAAAAASLKDAQLVPERRRLNASIREATFQWLASNGYSFIPSQSNCFLLDTQRPAKDVIAAMAEHNVFIGRIWPVLPTHVRITVGTREEMEQFQSAFQLVMKAAAQGRLPSAPNVAGRHLDGPLVRSNA
ncbi:MAG: pyridoxal phosphate-dependent aminotransferase [Acidobacteriia bacterium]|nr:pyridoxal phosphate-dependent aminotransferase [Terriglobia bacterium]